LQAKGYESYVPVYQTRRRWSDRTVLADAPLFSSYVFCRFDYSNRLPVMITPGVASIVGFGSDPAPIPDAEIEAVQAVLRSGLASEPCPFLREGQRIRITQGALKDVEGILVRKKSDWRLIVSVTMLQRSVSVEVDHAYIAAV
jgi:transcription antitermination factor NusG